MNNPTIAPENLLAEYLKDKFLWESGALYRIEDHDLIEVFIADKDKYLYEDEDMQPDDPDDKNPVIPFNEKVMQLLFEQSLIVSLIKSTDSDPLLEAMKHNNDVVLYYKGNSIQEIAKNLLKHPHVQYLVGQEENIPLIYEEGGCLSDFANKLSFGEVWWCIERSWNIFQGFGLYEI